MLQLGRDGSSGQLTLLSLRLFRPINKIPKQVQKFSWNALALLQRILHTIYRNSWKFAGGLNSVRATAMVVSSLVVLLLLPLGLPPHGWGLGDSHRELGSRPTMPLVKFVRVPRYTSLLRFHIPTLSRKACNSINTEITFLSSKSL